MTAASTKPFVAVALIVSLLCSGCVSTRTQRLARYELGSPPVSEPVKHTAVYRVKWMTDRTLHAVPQTERIVHDGQTVGFETTEDGRLIAYAGGDRIDLGRLPPQARFALWQTQYKVPTQLSRETGKALVGTVIVTGIVLGLAALVALELYLNAHNDD